MTGAGRPLAFVTGGEYGMGADIARAFHDAGYCVALASRTNRGLAAQLGPAALHIPCDVGIVEDVERAVAAAVAWGGALHVVVNNAGRSGWRKLADIDEAFWDEMVSVNLKGVLFTCRAAARHFSAGGCIINISSLAGKRGSAHNAVYCAAKFGVNGLTQALAKELGPAGIRVNAVCPVYVDTPGLREALDAPESPAGGGDIDAYLAAFARTQAALGRLPTGREVAAACAFLASPAAAAITGQCLNVDCGVLPS